MHVFKTNFVKTQLIYKINYAKVQLENVKYCFKYRYGLDKAGVLPRAIEGGCDMQKGRRVTAGDTIGVIAPSSPATDEEVKRAKEELQLLGFKTVLGRSCYASYGGYLAGPPALRASDVHSMFEDEGIDAIMCLRGGYGTPQILNLLDFQVIASHPKVFIGFSDITALHIAFQQKAHLATLHGPMASKGIASLPPVSKDYLLRAMMEPRPLGAILNPEEEKIGCLVKGQAKGRIIGGNLSLIAATMGTPFEIDTEGKILFLEDCGEEPYRIDRMLTQLALGGKFSDASGVILGSWRGCDPANGPDGFAVVDIFKTVIEPFGRPAIYNLQAGHDCWNLALPLGVEASLDATNRTLTIDESVVKD